MRILTADEMAQVDRRAIEEIGVPSLVLMENAAIGVADALAERYPDAQSAAVFCGPGNNGGDGLAIARHLDARGYRCRVILVTRGGRPKGDAGIQLEILEKLGHTVESLGPDDDVDALLAACADLDLLVDALFGTGLSRPLEGHFADLVRGLERLPSPIVAVDIPSGLDGSRGETIGPHVEADLTVTFAAPKLAHVFAPAAEAVGELVVADLGVPDFLVEEAPGHLHLLTDEALAACLTRRAAESHKGTYGHVLIVAGGPGGAGALVLAARAAVRGGAGLVTAAVPGTLAQVADLGSPESLTLPLPSDGGHIGAAAADVLRGALDGKTAIALGPGLGTASATVTAVRRFVRELALPLVLDADGLNAFAGRAADLSERTAPTILTPHPGEMARLLDVSTADVQADRVTSVRRAAETTAAVVILKGHQTLVATPEGEVYLNPTGNAGMASGGSGDVLTGLAGALLAQAYEPLVAAQLAVYLHGLAGDLALVAGGPEGLAAGDVVDALPRAFARLRGV